MHAFLYLMVKTGALMIRYTSQNQLTFDGFKTPFDHNLNKKNRWVVLAALLPWDKLAGEYAKKLNPSLGRYGIDIRVVLGAMIIKHKEKLSDRGTVLAIEENIYMQYFCGYSSFCPHCPFDASLFVDLRKRIGHDAYKKLYSHVINTYEELTGKKKAKKTNHAKTDRPVGESKMKNKNEHENQVDQSGRSITSEEQAPKKEN